MFKLSETPDLILNKDAHKNYNENFTEFMKESKKCVHKSIEDRFKNPANSILKFSDHIPIHDKVLD
jgi:hypothetical protein